MSNYTKATNFAIKDDLVTTDPAKIIKGTEIDNEYNAISNAIASKADVNSPALTGTPTAPTAGAGTNTTQIATTAFALANGIPSGCIVMWSGTIASIPSGWVLCNGSNSTPDLRNKFVIGAHSDTSGIAYTTITGANTRTGGTKDAIVVSHTHTFSGTTGSMNRNNPHSHGIGGREYGGGGNPGGDLNGPNTDYGYRTYNTDINHEHTFSGTTASSGSSGTNQNLPPYYALAYIMKS